MGPFAPPPFLHEFALAGAPPIFGRPAGHGTIEGSGGEARKEEGGSGAAAMRAKSGPPPPLADNAAREKVLQRWIGIARVLKPKASSADLGLMVKETLETKAAGTLQSRASSWMLYLGWCRGLGFSPWPLEEDQLHAYLRNAAASAPTRAPKFLESVGFAAHHFGLRLDHLVTARARGIAQGGMKRKRELTKMLPFPAAVVTAWEEKVVEQAAKVDTLSPKEVAIGVVTGFFLWLVHGRLRFADAARTTTEPKLDVTEGEGYVENEAKRGQHKTGHGARRAGRLLPQVAIATGVSGRPWAESWLLLRVRAGLFASADGSLQPELLSGWRFGAGRMRS